MNNKSLSVGVVGLGKMGLLHATILNTLPNVEIKALCEKGALLRKVCKKMFAGVQVVDDLEKLSNLDLDVAYVSTPIPSHFAVTKTIYDNGIARNVFIEKTLASSYDEAKKICDLAQSSVAITMVGYMKRFGVTFRKAKAILDQNGLGEIVSFDSYAYSSDFFGGEKQSKASASRGGVLSDLGAHVIDLALWFFGDLEVGLAKFGSLVEGGSDDFVHFGVMSSEGLAGQFDISWCKENYRLPEFGLLIRGSEGVMRVNDDEVELKLNDEEPSLWHRHDLDDHVGFLLGAPEYFREDEYFIKSVLAHSNVEPNFDTASKVDYVIDQVKSRAEK